MDSKEAKALVNNLRKAKNASSPYYWSFVLEGEDGDPCLFFEKKEGLAKKKAKEARKTARKKKVAMGVMDYFEGKMILRSDGKIADSLIIKAIKKLIKTHGELSLLKRLTVDSTPEETPQESVTNSKKKKKSSSEPKNKEESVGNTTTENDVNTELEVSNRWKAQWEAKYQQVKDILKTAHKSSAAQKEKVRAKITEYKERLQKARKSFKAAIAPFDSATRDRLDGELEAARKSVLRMAERLNIAVNPLNVSSSAQEEASPTEETQPSMDSFQKMYSKLDTQFTQIKKTIETSKSTLNDAKRETTVHSNASREKMGLADSILLVISSLLDTLDKRFVQFASVVQKTTDVRAAKSLSEDCSKNLTELEQKQDEVLRLLEEVATLHKNTTPAQPLQEAGRIGPLLLQAQGLEKLTLFSSTDGDENIKKTRAKLQADIKQAITDLQMILSQQKEGSSITPAAEEKQEQNITELAKRCSDLETLLKLGDASVAVDEKVQLIWQIGFQKAQAELERFKQSITSNPLVTDDIRFAVLAKPLQDFKMEDALMSEIQKAGSDTKKLEKAIKKYEKSIASDKKKWSSIDSNSHFGSFSIVSSIESALSDIKSTIQK